MTTAASEQAVCGKRVINMGRRNITYDVYNASTNYHSISLSNDLMIAGIFSTAFRNGVIKISTAPTPLTRRHTNTQCTKAKKTDVSAKVSKAKCDGKKKEEQSLTCKRRNIKKKRRKEHDTVAPNAVFFQTVLPIMSDKHITNINR